MENQEKKNWKEQVRERTCDIVPGPLRKLCGLYEMALDQRRSSSAYADDLWSLVDPELWFKMRNPWLILQMISHERLEKLANDENFMQVFQAHLDTYDAVLATEGWFAKTHPQSPLKTVAYFSMEFGLSEALPIYSGGLGILAGDHLKTAHDLDVPVIGVGLLYQQGYFRQYLDANGRQLEVYPYNDPSQLPLVRARNPDGERIFVKLDFPGRPIYLRVWEVNVGRTRLYLLDSNDLVNTPLDRGITSSLYGGTVEHRLQQEIVLGLGGWKLFQSLKIVPEVCHLNEGHAAFVVLARAKSYMEENKTTFEEALTITRAGNIFTTHTPVTAGFDRFPGNLVAKYFDGFSTQIGISIDDLLALGRENALDPTEPFNMAYLAFRGSAAVNGVSKLHGQVSRKLFSSLFPRWPYDEIPVGYVTNGIHIPSWESPKADALWSKACGKERRWWINFDCVENDFKQIDDKEIWELRVQAKKALIDYIRLRVSNQRRIQGRPEESIKQAETIFNPEVLTVGFARRFASYKRVNLLLQDKARLLQLISDTNQPIQIVVAGKAHPQDQTGKAMIEEWMHFIRRPEVSPHIVFLADYDILMAERLVHGVDVWLNTPRLPMEASGTSGMKVLANGGLNLSELDGWWAEAYRPEVGWALGDGKEHGQDPAWDYAEAQALYALLEQQVKPLYYHRDKSGVPKEWVKLIRNSMIKLAPRFSTVRMMQEYVEQYYLPAASLYQKRSENNGKRGKEIQSWRKAFSERWKYVQFVDMQIQEAKNRHIFTVKVHQGSLKPDDLRVELYAIGPQGKPAFRQAMACQGQTENEGVYRYTAEVLSVRPATDFTPRIMPEHAGLLVPGELGEILWQR